MKIIDVSNMNGQEFADAVVGNGETCFVLNGESNNKYLKKVSEPELNPRFKIGDCVRLSNENIEFNSLGDIYKTMKCFVTGLRKVENRYLYTVCKDGNEYDFFGYELTKMEE